MRLFGGRTGEEKEFPVHHSEEEWHKLLNSEQYRVLRQHGTERAGTSPLNGEKRVGALHLRRVWRACSLVEQTKFESGTGWPSFYEPLPGAVETSEDRSLFMSRTEVHCAKWGGHLGHVFPDGPQPTGERYYTNGVAMGFKAGG